MAGKIQSMAVSDVSFGLSREARAKAEGEAQSQAIEQFKTVRGRTVKSVWLCRAMACARVSVSGQGQG